MLKLFFLCLVIGLTSAAINVAFIHTDGPYGDSEVADVVKKVVDISPGEFNITTIDAADFTPSFAELNQHTVLFIWSAYSFFNWQAFGNVVADYVDSGKGVVVANFGLSIYQYNSLVGGRFLGNSTNTYYTIYPGGYLNYPRESLIPIDTASPILRGVIEFEGGEYSYRGAGFWHSTTTRVAAWSDNTPLIGTRVINGGRRVDLNFYPVSSDINEGYWESDTDGGRIIHNALLWAATGAN